MSSREILEVKQQIAEFKELFKDNPEKLIREGTWFESLVQMILTKHAAKVNAAYFKEKYVGLDDERIAYRLVDATSNYVSIAGGIAAGAASAAQVATFISAGGTIAAFVATLIGEISFITYKQLELIYDISVILNAKLDKDDPEDILTIFWFALGVNLWEDATNMLLKAGPRSAEYLGRKALRSGLRSAMQSVITKFGGTKLAQKLTEKALIKLIVPGINIPIAAVVNKKFTKALGKRAINNFKLRGASIKIIDNMKSYERTNLLVAVALIYHVGIIGEDVKKISKCAEMQNNVVKRIVIRKEEEILIDNLIDLDFDEFCSIIVEIEDLKVKNYLAEIACISAVISKDKNDEKLSTILRLLDEKNPQQLFQKYRARLL